MTNRFATMMFVSAATAALSGGAFAASHSEAPEGAATEAMPAGEQPAGGAMDHGGDMASMEGGMTASVAGADGADHGTVTATPTASGMMHVMLDLQGVPQGVMAVHIHETGECTAPTFESAGGHLAAEGQEHGVMTENGPHVGDLPNIHVPESGAVMVEYFVPELTAEMMMDDDGSAFVMHAQKDDETSQPSGDAGDRLACGVFGEAS